MATEAQKMQAPDAKTRMRRADREKPGKPRAEIWSVRMIIFPLDHEV
jgi:hypothetical protein